MEGTYAVMIGKSKAGQVVVERQGLYYCFTCRCELHSEVICRVTLCIDGHQESLGILVPIEGHTFGLCKRLPVKSLVSGIPEFRITPKQSLPEGSFIDVYPEEPFQYISRLERAYLVARRGKTGIVIPELNHTK